MKSLTDPAVRADLRVKVAEIALREVGYGESPPGSNRTKYGAWNGMDGVAWCASFVSWCYGMAAEKIGCPNPLAGLQTRNGFARVTTTYPIARRWGIVLGKDEPVMLGDVVIWSKGRLGALVGANGHTGLVTSLGANGSFYVTEGNTDPQYSRTGGNVMMHKHACGDGLHGHLLAIYRPTRRYGRA